MKTSSSSSLASVSLFLIAFIFCGCATLPHVGHRENNVEDVSAYDSFIILPIPNLEHDPAAMMVLGDGSFPIFAVKKLFEERGFKYSAFDDADILVGVRALYAEPEVAEFTGDGLADLRNTYPGIKSHQVKDGLVMDTASNVFDLNPGWVMIVEVFEKKPLQLIWSGWSTTTNRRFFESDENKMLTLRRIMEKFPD